MKPDARTLEANGAFAVTAAGETLWLLPEHAIWWPAAGMLMVADVHFGKAAAFRALGQPVPHGTTGDNLALLTRLTRQLPVDELVFLGDFLHARAARTQALLRALDNWRHSLPPHVCCTLVRGNHDARAGDPPESLDISVVTEPAVAGPFALCHMPGASAQGYVLAGHLHPACRLRGAGADSLRLPCFLFGPHGAILPAFGAFTGHATVRPQPDERAYVVGGDRVWPVGPARRPAQNSV